MHAHFADMFNAIEFGIRFQERNRIDEGPVKPPTAAPVNIRQVERAAEQKAAEKTEEPAKKQADPAPKSDAGKGKKELDKAKDPKPGVAGTIGAGIDDAAAGVAEAAKPITAKMVGTVAEAGAGIAQDVKNVQEAQKGIVDAALADPKGAKEVLDAVDTYNKQKSAGNAGDVVDAYVKFAGDLGGRLVPAVGNAIVTNAASQFDAAGQIAKALAAPQLAALSGIADGVSSGVNNSLNETAKKVHEDGQAIADVVKRTNDSREDFVNDTKDNWEDLVKTVHQDQAAVSGGGFFAQAGGNLDAYGHTAEFVGKTALDYTTRSVQAGVDQLGTTAKVVADAVVAPYAAVGNFFSGLFGGGSKGGVDPQAAGTGNPDYAKTGKQKGGKVDKESDPTGDDKGTSGSGSSTIDDYQYQVDSGTAKQPASTPHQSADAAERAAEQAAQTADKPQQTADAAERAAEPAAQPAPAAQLDVTTPEGQAQVLDKAVAANLVPAGTSFDASGQAVYTVQPGDGFWQVAEKFSGSGGVDTDLWLATRAANGDKALYAGHTVIVPGRSAQELAAALDG